MMEMGTTDRDVYDKKLSPVLKEIQKNFKMNDQERKENVKKTTELVDYFVSNLKEQSGLFKLIYNRPIHTGSAYSGLRIKEATEFDINLALHKPFKLSGLWKIEFPVPGFATFRLIMKNLDSAVPDNWKQYIGEIKKKLVDADGYLRPDHVRSWAQSLVDKVPQRRAPFKYSPSSNGPARTFYFQGVNDKMVSVDLAFVFEVEDPSWNNRLSRFKASSAEKARKGNPNQKVLLVPCNERDTKLWRISFPEAEKKILEGYGAVLPIVKTLKYMRDVNQWVFLKSHFLKTLVMTEVVFHHPEAEYWREKHLGSLFMKMLQSLAEKVAVKGGIAMIWEPKFDYLYGRTDQIILENNKHRLERIINKINKNFRTNPGVLLDFLNKSSM